MLQFEEMISHFAAAGHGVVAFDYVGCGRSPKPQDWHAYAFDALRADLAAVVAKYGPQAKRSGLWSPKVRRNVLVCHSAGCALALGLVTAERAVPPTVVDGLLLMGASFHPEGFKPPGLFYLPALVLSWMQPQLSAGFEALALHPKTRQGATEARQRVLQLAQEVNASNPSYMFKAYYRQVALPSADEVRAAGAKVPVGLIVGDSDKLVPRAATDALRVLLAPDTTLDVIEEAAHQQMQEDPAACIAILERFLRRL